MKISRAALFSIVSCLAWSVSVAPVNAQGGPGFRGGRGGGPDSRFFADRDDFHFLLEHHDKIRREVKNITGGVETLTESDDPEVAARLKKHVAAMYRRVEKGEPIRMRDPLFREIFRHADKIAMKYVETAKGVRVTETSKDPYVASLIREHAKVVTGFVKHGFDEAHRNHPLPGRTLTAAKKQWKGCGQCDHCQSTDSTSKGKPQGKVTGESGKCREKCQDKAQPETKKGRCRSGRGGCPENKGDKRNGKGSSAAPAS